MQNHSSIKTDPLLAKGLNSRLFYACILAGVLWYAFQDDKILNVPQGYFWLRLGTAFTGLLLLFCFRYLKYKLYYQRKFRDAIFCISFLIGSLVFSMIFQGIMGIPLNAFIIYYSKQNPVESFNCQITNALNINIDKVHFRFLNEDYGRYLDINDYSRNDLINNYYLVVEARKSLFNTYCINKMYFKRKDGNG